MPFARQLVSAAVASARLFGTYLGPHDLGPTGRKLLLAPLKGPAIASYYNGMKEFEQYKLPWVYNEKQENQYWKQFRRSRKGHAPVQKGKGKKAQKRAKEAAKAAAKAAGKKK
eukprot:TRINITY_DN4380_c0_g1_i1.p1 TRINITY_DN4380_c0_g1~~TRINITY_DN4380_c0_g1_i1.p1  ORF type:complete len:113 (-),score=37.95 TRINITY_DN4380_c0_g1_i1:152-490(-)